MSKGYDTYKNANIETASQGKLILIAYDVAIKHCKNALGTFGDVKRIEERTKHLFKAQDAITELMSSLKLDVGEIAQNLYALYDYMLRTLVESNVKDNKSKTVEILGYLETLRESWSFAIENLKKEKNPSVDAPQQGFAITG